MVRGAAKIWMAAAGSMAKSMQAFVREAVDVT
jgi:hypothetical protein